MNHPLHKSKVLHQHFKLLSMLLLFFPSQRFLRRKTKFKIFLKHYKTILNLFPDSPLIFWPHYLNTRCSVILWWPLYTFGGALKWQIGPICSQRNCTMVPFESADINIETVVGVIVEVVGGVVVGVVIGLVVVDSTTCRFS